MHFVSALIFSKALRIHSLLKPAHEKIGVVDAQWIVHQSVPSLGNEVTDEANVAAYCYVKYMLTDDIDEPKATF